MENDSRISKDEDAPWTTFSVYFEALEDFALAADRLSDIIREYGCDMADTSAWRWLPRVGVGVGFGGLPIFEISARLGRKT